MGMPEGIPLGDPVGKRCTECPPFLYCHASLPQQENNRTKLPTVGGMGVHNTPARGPLRRFTRDVSLVLRMEGWKEGGRGGREERKEGEGRERGRRERERERERSGACYCNHVFFCFCFQSPVSVRIQFLLNLAGKSASQACAALIRAPHTWATRASGRSRSS